MNFAGVRTAADGRVRGAGRRGRTTRRTAAGKTPSDGVDYTGTHGD